MSPRRVLCSSKSCGAAGEQRTVPASAPRQHLKEDVANCGVALAAAFDFGAAGGAVQDDAPVRDVVNIVEPNCEAL